MTLPTNYGYELNAAFAGMLADLQHKQALSAVQGEASAEIPFGAAVILEASTQPGTPDAAKLPVDANSRIGGVVVHAHNYQAEIQLGDVGIKPTNLLSVLRKGRIYVLWEGGAVARGANLYVRHTAGVGEQKGAFRHDADTADAALVRGFVAAETVTADGRSYLAVDVDVDAYNAVNGLT